MTMVADEFFGLGLPRCSGGDSLLSDLKGVLGVAGRPDSGGRRNGGGGESTTGAGGWARAGMGESDIDQLTRWRTQEFSLTVEEGDSVGATGAGRWRTKAGKGAREKNPIGVWRLKIICWMLISDRTTHGCQSKEEAISIA